MKEGIILKALSGFYYVYTDGRMISCKARGNMRRKGLSPLVGDKVEITDAQDGTGVIETVLTRTNSFIRPAVANIDTMVFVASAAIPVTDPYLIDRVSVIADKAGCDFVVCINKSDLNSADSLFDTYRSVGIPVVRTSAESGEGMEELLSLLQGKICALTGNSGVGKSSIVNSLIPGANIETDVVSEHLGRGKHTTRHVEFYAVNETTFIADTPGFASFDIEMVDTISAEELQNNFVEFTELIGNCRFNDCRHISEPDCAVRNAVGRNQIPSTRYESYRKLYDIVINHKPWD